MFFLTPRHVKYGREFAKDARKLLAYKRDLLDAETLSNFEAGIAKLEDAVKTRKSSTIEEAAAALDKQCGAFVKPKKDAGLRENCEVFLVAIIVALGVRTYFLQPFTIPTGSMFPTLNGIIGTKTDEEPPNIVTRLAHFAWHGRTYVNVVATTDDVITDVREVKALPFTDIQSKFGVVSRTEIVGRRNSYIVDCPIDTLTRDLIRPLREFKAGDVIARGYFNTGDHVFVDKMSYHFRKPKGGEVFVFNTHKIQTNENRGKPDDWPSQFYIKRLIGTPLDTLQIKPPQLFINGKLAEGYGFGRVMSGTRENPHAGYAGYGNGFPSFSQIIMRTPDDPFQVPDKNYFAMGDNSYHSSDSRDWGPVPQQNIMGRGVFVYWPFTPHFGLIR